jgi:hypothetical protein
VLRLFFGLLRRPGRLRTVGLDHDQPGALEERPGIDVWLLGPRRGRGGLDGRRRRSQLFVVWLFALRLLAPQAFQALLLAQRLLGVRLSRYVRRRPILVAVLAVPVAPAAAPAAALLIALAFRGTLMLGRLLLRGPLLTLLLFGPALLLLAVSLLLEPRLLLPVTALLGALAAPAVAPLLGPLVTARLLAALVALRALCGRLGCGLWGRLCG